MSEFGGQGLLHGLQPLTRYLSFSSGLKELETDQQEKLGKAVSDWGFDTEDFHSLSSPTLVGGAENISFDEDSEFKHYSEQIDSYNDWGPSPRKLQRPTRITPVSIRTIFQKIIAQFKRLEAASVEFQDEFRYILISSQLLDETILVSKYYTTKKISSLKLNKKKLMITRFGKILKLNSDFSINPSDEQSFKIIPIIFLLKYFFKSSQFYNQRHVTIVLIVVLISLLNMLELKSFKIMLIQRTLLNDLKKFIKIYQKLDLLLQKFNNKYKELKLFSNMFEENNANPLELNHTLSLINCSTITLTRSIYSKIAEILPITNKVELENYCDIYNVNVTELSYILQENESMIELNDSNTIEHITESLKNFHYLRRFYLCCLLAIGDEYTVTGETRFSSNISKLFKSSKKNYRYPILLKWSAVSSNLKKLTGLGESSKLIMDEYDLSCSNKFTENNSNKEKPSDILEKIKELQSQLRLFDRSQPIEDQVTEFTKVGQIIESLNTIFQRDLSTLKKSLDKKPFNLTSSLSLKKTREINIRKRYSMPISSQKSPVTPTRTVSLNQPQSDRRLSTGLSIPLLTLLEVEEPEQKRTVSYDDNYINITPKHSEELDYKIKKDYISEKNLISNDDSVIISKNKEKEEEEIDVNDVTSNILSEDDLKKVLESKFGAITNYTTIPLTEITNIEKNDELNKNDQQSQITGSLEFKNELQAALRLQTTG